MAKTHTKEAAESLLRELPSVVGAFVREDIHGNPREIHVLIGPGPNPRHLARDIRDMLEEKIGVAVDQRVISIAQLAVDAENLAADLGQVGILRGAQPDPIDDLTDERLQFETLETQTRDGMFIVRVRLQSGERTVTGEGVEADVGLARVRAAAVATLNAAAVACNQRMRFQLDTAAPIKALGREYIFVSVLASSPLLGRKAMQLTAAQPIDEDSDHATAALAVLHAINRVVALALKS